MRWLRFVHLRPVSIRILPQAPPRWPPDKAGEYDNTGPGAARIRVLGDMGLDSQRRVAVHEVRHHVLAAWTCLYDLHLSDEQEHGLIALLEEADLSMREQQPDLWP